MESVPEVTGMELIRNRVTELVWKRVWDEVWDPVGVQVLLRERGRVWDRAQKPVRQQASNQVGLQTEKQVKQLVEENKWS